MFAAIGLITATGAFTTVEAERTAEVSVAGDSAALLQLTANDSAGTNGSDYVTTDGAISIDFDGSDTDIGNDADGLNPNANTEFDSIIDITNQGNQNIGLSTSVNVTTNNVAGVSDQEIEDSIIITLSQTDLTSGEKSTVDIQVDHTDSNGAQIDDGDYTLTITITANQDDYSG